MRLLNSSLYNIPALNNKSINNVSFEASATWPATVSGIWNEYIYIWKWGTGKETSISWKFSSKKILRSSRKNFWGKKRNKFQTIQSFPSFLLIPLYYIFFYFISSEWIIKRRNRISVNHRQLVRWTWTKISRILRSRYIFRYIQKRDGISLLLIWKDNSKISHTSVYSWITWNRFKRALLITYAFLGFWDSFWSCPWFWK